MDKRTLEVQALLKRQADLPRHQHHHLAPALERLRERQLAAVQDAHREDFSRPGYRALFEYYAEHLHSGLDLRMVSGDGHGAFKLLSRMDETYPLLKSALAFSVLAQEMDDALALTGLAPEDALRQSGQHAQRLAHVQLLAPLGAGLAPYTRSRIAQATFKMAMLPLRATALSPLVSILDRGYDVLRKLDPVEPEFSRLLDNNRRAVETLYPP